MSTGSRLFQYAKYYKKIILSALLILTIAVSLELTGPFIAKKMIDSHILGIEKPWYAVDESAGSVLYNQQWYRRHDYINKNEMKGDEVRVLQVGRKYLFINEPVEEDGTRKYENGKLTISYGNNEQRYYTAVPLTAMEAFEFFKPGIKPLFMLALLYFVLVTTAAGFHLVQTYLLQVSANRIIQKMRLDVYEQIQRLPIPYFDNMPAGKIVSRVTNDTEAIREMFVKVIATFLTSFIYIGGIYVALFLLDIRVAMISLFLIPILVFWIIMYRKFASKYNRVIRSRLSDINAIINESIQGMPVIKAFRREKETMREFEMLNQEHLKYQNKLLHLNSVTSHNLVGVVRNIAFVALIWYFGGASLGVGSIVSIGVLYAFVDYLNRLFHPIVNLINQLPQLELSLVAAERVFELMDEEGTDVVEGSIPRYAGNVRFNHVWFAYKEEEFVLKDISLEVKQGQTIALVGHTGSGKSSIMNLLFRFYDANHGSITIDGESIVDVPKQMLRKHMGIVLQDPCLFTGTIASNVSLNAPDITQEVVEQSLRDVGAEQLFRNLPKGYDEPVIEKGSTLSAGQRQLISFARALAFNPAILILDEATASVDTETEVIIQKALETLKKNRTTFIIAHRLSTIKNADQIIVLDHGEIVERGNHEELMRIEGRYRQMFELQQGKKQLSL